ncbi:MAG: hypothetical protein U5M23_13005 [Marinagarivorans sp.]|nr:hypothetical protein [Marinagarivorans sp.]
MSEENNVAGLLRTFLLDENSSIEDREIGNFKDAYSSIKAQLIEGITQGHAQMHTVAAMAQELNEPFIFEDKVYLRLNIFKRCTTENPFVQHKWVTPVSLLREINNRFGLGLPDRRPIMVDPFSCQGNLYTEVNAVMEDQVPELMKHYRALNAVISELSGRAKAITNILVELDRQEHSQHARGQDPLSKIENNLAKKYLGFALTTNHDFNLLRKKRLNVTSSTPKPKNQTISKMRIKM